MDIQRDRPQTEAGNAGATNLRGEHQLLLLVYRLTYPKATADEARTFIALHSANPRIYSR